MRVQPGRTRIFAITCGLALFCADPAAAQGFGLGAKAGVNIANQRTEGDEGSVPLDPRIAGVAGVFATMPLAGWFEFQPEALYAMKGTRLNLDGVKSSVWVDYLELPMLVRISRRGAGKIHYYIVGGPSIAVQLRARSRTEFGRSTEEIDVGDELERLDYGVAAGGGIEIGSIVIDGRYTLGLKDIDKDKSDTVQTTNRALSLTVGFRF